MENDHDGVFSESLVFVAASNITQTRITCKDCKHGGHFFWMM
ncbi:hypothetical protein HanOQP8_Chr12g0455091 [Helianthus annuus]|nr:hypothetical protein HanHA89_Chr12g0478501 [Helianthus annuus]KAJ0675804.1 hypothetical protein HanLR1_Chr12g0455401 [Helianthus annuus]KAJ0679064.1 hypothetical protein HanOQP8_Chr12g0455091 [Helianthus annuus]